MSDDVMEKLEELYELAIEVEDISTGLAIVDYMARRESQCCEKGDKK